MPHSRPRRAPRLGAPVALALGALAAGASRAAAQNPGPGVSVRLSYDAGTKPGIAVLPVRGAAGDSVQALLRRDLDFGDRVAVVSVPALDASASAGGRIDYELARRAGAAGVLAATVTPGGALHVELHDVTARRVLQARDVTLPAVSLSPDWRLAVHAASDEVERWATGTRGAAATRVLFVRDRRVWSVDSDGENAHALTEPGALSPAWHPSARAFVHSTLGDDGAQRVVARAYTATGAGGQAGSAGRARVLADRRVTNMTPAVAPDGHTVVFAHGEEEGADLFAVDFDGGAAHRVTVGRGSDNVSPSFSPDGRRLAFTSGRSGHPEVYISDADGTSPELLTDFDFGTQNYRSNPDWSPDGRLVAFQALVGGQFQIMTIEVRGRTVRRLTTAARNEDPSWAPDARHVVVTSTRTGVQQLWVLDAESGRARQLTRGAGGARMGTWSPPLAR